MKKLLVVPLSCFAFAIGNISAQVGHTDTTAPYNGFRNVITYDARNNKISDIEQEFIGNAWHSFGINKATYNEHSNILNSISQYGWKNFFTYDSRNNMTSRMTQYWRDSTMSTKNNIFISTTQTTIKQVNCSRNGTVKNG